jgi:hypothetical protein
MPAVTSRVEIESNGGGDLVLQPIRTDRGMDLLDTLQGFESDPAFGEQLDAMRREEQLPMQDREAL